MDRQESYDVAGPAGAPALVLVHGVTVNRKMWLPHTPLLAQKYRVITVDLPGHGALSAIPFTLAEASRMLAKVIHREAGGRALLVGDSLGGYAAMAFADDHPEAARALVLASCSLDLRGVVGTAARAGGVLMRRVLLYSPFLRRYERMAERELRAVAETSIADLVMEIGLRQGARPEAFLELAGRDFPSMVRRFPGPILILNGERDRPFRRHEGRFLAAAQQGRLQHMGRVGHTGSLERPGKFAAAILDFASSAAASQ